MPLRPSRLANRIATYLRRALGGEAAAGVLLIFAATAAMIMANSRLDHFYHSAFHASLPWTPLGKLNTLHAWINDGLMALFFFAVGLEIKREILDGELATPARRRLPLVAALSGMVMPALFYALIAGSHPSFMRGWAIPAATDIAFALGVLALVGKGLPSSLRLFLLTVAIVDDLGAVIIIALFYTAQLNGMWLGASFAVLLILIAVNRWGFTSGWVYSALAFLLWICVLHSGVHATVAGVAAALAVPLRLNSRGDSLLLRMEHALTPWNGYFIIPLFGFANAGVSLAGTDVAALLAPLPLGIATGLVLGKQLGIFGAIVLAERAGFAMRPAGTTMLQLWGLALLCGIGFTMSLFIAALAFPSQPDLVDQAKLGVLTGSLISAMAGYLVLRLSRTR